MPDRPTDVEHKLEQSMRWIGEEPISVSTMAEIGYQQAIQLERIADALERISFVPSDKGTEAESDG